MRQLSGWTARLLKYCAAISTAGSGRDSLLVLMFHRILPEPDPLLPDEPDVATFTAQIDILRAICTVLPLTEATDRLYANSLPPRAACLTFDDGYRNNLTHAAPILAARQLPATIFVTAEFLRGGYMWTDVVRESVRCARETLDLSAIGLGNWLLPDVGARRRAIRDIVAGLKYLPHAERVNKVLDIATIVGAKEPAHLMLKEGDLSRLVAQGIEVGAHTLSHPILSRLDDQEAQRQICESKATLESVIRMPVRSFAYPNGMPDRDYSHRHVEMVRSAGFAVAVSSAWGVCRPSSDRFQLPRMRPWESSTVGFAGRLLYTRRAPREMKV